MTFLIFLRIGCPFNFWWHLPTANLSVKKFRPFYHWLLLLRKSSSSDFPKRHRFPLGFWLPPPFHDNLVRFVSHVFTTYYYYYMCLVQLGGTRRNILRFQSLKICRSKNFILLRNVERQILRVWLLNVRSCWEEDREIETTLLYNGDDNAQIITLHFSTKKDRTFHDVKTSWTA